MTMLQVRDVVDRGDDGGRVAIVHVFDDGRVAVMPIEEDKAWPQIVDGVELEHAVDRGEMTLHDPIIPPALLRSGLSESETKAASHRWEVIKPIVETAPGVFDPVIRGELVRKAAGGGAASPPSIRKYLRWYWQRGMTPAALVGDWSKCGAKGVQRDEGDKKRGAPKRHGTYTGLNLNRGLRQLIRKVIWSRYRKNGELKLSQTYREVCGRHFYEGGYVEELGRSKRKLKPEFEKTGPITARQFEYFFRRYVDGLGLQRERRGPRVWDLTERGLPGTVTAESRGPSSRYVIDATILDVYIRSRINPSRIVGRAVLYVVIDVWSRMIVGVYVGVENASWTCAMMALANVVEDKVTFCKRHGITIEPHEWPNSGIGERLLSDGGEMTSETADQLVKHFNLKVETASSYRGDLKGLVENVFHVVPTEIGAYVPGWIHPDFRARGAEDYRLESALDIEDVTQQVILAIIRRNNDVPVKRYDRDAGMPAADVAPFPVDLWRYGVAHRSGRAVRWPEQFVRFRLMPEDTATVDATGLRFRGVWYLSDGMRARGWLEKGRTKPFKVRISYDPRRMGSVYLHMDGTEFGFELCSLNEARSRAYVDRSNEPSFWDLSLEEEDRKDGLADARERALRSGIEVIDAARQIATNALERQEEVQDLSRREQLEGIRANRQIERAVQQALDGMQFAPELPAPQPVPEAANDMDEDDLDIDIFGIVGKDRD